MCLPMLAGAILAGLLRGVPGINRRTRRFAKSKFTVCHAVKWSIVGKLAFNGSALSCRQACHTDCFDMAMIRAATATKNMQHRHSLLQ
jgi:hypothetical protein